MASQTTAPVLQLRVALTTQDYERLTRFYCQGLGIEPAAVWTNQQGHGMMLEMGQATLEIFDEVYAASVDEIETGTRTSGAIRFAIEVPDLQAAIEQLVANGATLLHEPVVTPWGDYNARLQAPDGMQITLFQPQGHA